MMVAVSVKAGVAAASDRRFQLVLLEFESGLVFYTP